MSSTAPEGTPEFDIAKNALESLAADIERYAEPDVRARWQALAAHDPPNKCAMKLPGISRTSLVAVGHLTLDGVWQAAMKMAEEAAIDSLASFYLKESEKEATISPKFLTEATIFFAMTN